VHAGRTPADLPIREARRRRREGSPYQGYLKRVKKGRTTIQSKKKNATADNIRIAGMASTRVEKRKPRKPPGQEPNIRGSGSIDRRVVRRG